MRAIREGGLLLVPDSARGGEFRAATAPSDAVPDGSSRMTVPPIRASVKLPWARVSAEWL